jgi:hypothetical protein
MDVKDTEALYLELTGHYLRKHFQNHPKSYVVKDIYVLFNIFEAI